MKAHKVSLPLVEAHLIKRAPSNEAVQTPRCQESIRYGEVQGVFNLVGDIYLLILPMPAVWALQITRRKKFGIMAIFMTGFL